MQQEAVIAKYHPTHNAINETDQKSLDKLEKDKVKLTKKCVKDLTKNLTPNGLMSFQSYILQVIKPGIIEHKSH